MATELQQRHLARSKDGWVIHRADCRHVWLPWYAADTLTDDELWQVKVNFGYRICKTCNPDWRITPEDAG